MKSQKNQLRNEIRLQIKNWNDKFPIDYWWRKKYNIPYGSEEHRNANLIDMFYDYEEQKIMNRLIDKIQKEREDEDKEVDKHFGIPEPVGEKMTKDEIDDSFEKLNIEDFNKK